MLARWYLISHIWGTFAHKEVWTCITKQMNVHNHHSRVNFSARLWSILRIPLWGEMRQCDALPSPALRTPCIRNTNTGMGGKQLYKQVSSEYTRLLSDHTSPPAPEWSCPCQSRKLMPKGVWKPFNLEELDNSEKEISLLHACIHINACVHVKFACDTKP